MNSIYYNTNTSTHTTVQQPKHQYKSTSTGNKTLQIMEDPQLKYIIRPFEGNINTVEKQGLKLYLWETRYI